MSEFIFSLRDVGKVTPRGKKILEGIHLSFIYGAKIGVRGSQWLREEHAASHYRRRGKGIPRRGNARKNIDVGYLPQEPQLDPDKTSVKTSSWVWRRRENFSPISTPSICALAKS